MAHARPGRASPAVPLDDHARPADRRSTQILSSADLGRTIDRIAHEILERNVDQRVVLVGIPSRGVPLAVRLTARVNRFAANDATDHSADHARPGPGRSGPGGRSQPGSAPAAPAPPATAGSLDITLYRDDLRRHPPRALGETRLPDRGIDDLLVVLVDDVLYSGRTVRAALDALRDHGRPSAVQLAVLIDRGHRQLPIRADYVGKNVPTAIGDDIAVRLAEVDGTDGVDLIRGAS